MKRDPLACYRRVLDGLRRDGQQFARQHPRVAGRLQLEEDQCLDPHVERLLEGVAFLTARVEGKLDDDFPELADTLAAALYPHALEPVPSFAMLQLEVDTERSIGRDGISVPRGTGFVSKRLREVAMRFRSTAPMVVQPIVLHDAEIRGSDEHGIGSVLRLRFEAVGEHPFGVMRCARLPLYLQGGAPASQRLYDRLATDLVACRFRQACDAPPLAVVAGGRAIALRGFDADDAALPWPVRSFPGFRLLQEYFAFADKFLWVDLLLPAELEGRSIVADLCFGQPLELDPDSVASDTLKLFCVPAVNLFPKVAEPIAWDPRAGEHRLVPEAGRPTELEVHSITAVTGVTADGARTVAYEPFYAVRHGGDPTPATAYWHAVRRPSPIPGDAGREVYLSLVDGKLAAADLAERTVLVETLCSNRDLPHRVRAWGAADDFVAESIAGLRSVRAVRHPTAARRPPAGSDGVWRLLSHLTLDQLALGREGAGFLRGMLRLYDFAADAAAARQIGAIADIACRPATRRLRTRAAIGFAHGAVVEVTLDLSRLDGASPVLFGGVLARFLAAYAPVNSFVELVLRGVEAAGSDRAVEIHRWPPLAGDRELL